MKNSQPKPRHARLFELIRQNGLIEQPERAGAAEKPDVFLLTPEFALNFQSRAHTSLGVEPADRRLTDAMRGAA